MLKRAVRFSVAVVAVPLVLSDAHAAEEKKVVNLSPGPEWKIASTFSGKTNYYTVVDDGKEKVLHAAFDPKIETTILYRKLKAPRPYRFMKWRWRVGKFPVGANETIEGKMDSAASVYVYFQGTFKKYLIKYVWSVSLEQGKHFETADSGVLKRMHLVVKQGPPPKTGEWRAEEVDLHADFRNYFFGGKADEEIPPVVGIGVLSDGDGTQSAVEADYAGFQLRD